MKRPLSLACMGLLVIGCEEPSEVAVYDIPTVVPAALQASAGGDSTANVPSKSPSRMLAAMVPVGGDVWFYKLMGPESAVDAVADTFQNWVVGLDYAAGAPVLEALPGDWRRGGERPFRFASVTIPVDEGEPLDVSVSKLARQDDVDGFVTMNVNRWRGQLGLPPSQERWAGAMPLEGVRDAVWVDLRGESSAGGPPMMAGGFREGDQMRTAPTPPRPPAGEAAGRPIDFEVPANWRPGRTSAMRLAAFRAGPEDNEAVLTVIPAGGELRPNVARWMGQIVGGSVDEAAVDRAMRSATEITVDGRSGQRFFLVDQAKPDDDGDAVAIDASVISIDDGAQLFVKMTGPASVVRDQRGAIDSFLKSLKIKM